MAGINHLYDIYNKKGSEFVEQLFNQFVTINEKMDGSAFSFERDKEDGNFEFYRRDQRHPITLVDRTLMKYYEKPIQYIESLPPNIVKQIPRGRRFGLEYFASSKPVEITYDRVPKNNLILSYIHDLDDAKKITKTIKDKDELDEWADLLGVERPPIIFQGNLDADQKSKLLDFLNSPQKGLIEKFKTTSFVRFIIKTLNPEMTKTALNNDLDKDVEGIVFRFIGEGKDQETVLAKMVDPIFTELAKQKSADKQTSKPSDFLGIALLDVMSFILENGLSKFEVDGNSDDERYISFISKVFVKFLDSYGDKYKGMDFEEPDYLKRDEFRLNKDIIKNRSVLKYVESDDSFESLFKLILNSFRKIKTRPGGIVTKGMLKQLNTLINDIKEYIKKKKSDLKESSFISFSEFRKEFIPAVDYIQDDEDDDRSNESPYVFGDFISKLESIDYVNEISDNNTEMLLENDSEDSNDDKSINVIMGRFQPFHNGHLKMVNFLKEKNDKKTFIIVVHPGHNKSGKSPFDKNIVKMYMDEITENHDNIEGYLFVSSGLLGSAIAKLIDKGYNPLLIGAGADRMEDYEKQMDYIKVSDVKDKLDSSFSLLETPRTSSSTKVRNILREKDYNSFKKLVPKEVANLYNNLAPLIK